MDDTPIREWSARGLMVDGGVRYPVGEIVGPAGAGKTTSLSAMLERHGAIVTAVHLGRRDKVRSLARLAGLLVPLVRPLARHGSWEEVRYMIYLDAWQRALRREGHRDRTVLMDHGPVFRLAALSEFGSPAMRTSRFRRWWNARLGEWSRVLDVVVYVDAPDDVLLRRVRERERYHCLKDEADEDSRRLLARYRSAFESILERLVGTGRTKVLRFDTSQTRSDDIAREVLQALPGSVVPLPPARADRHRSVASC